MRKLLEWTARVLIACSLFSTAAAQQENDAVQVAGQGKAVPAQKADAGGASSWVTLQAIEATAHHNNVQIEISLSASVTPVVSELNEPDRLVLDFPGTISSTPKNRVSVNRNDVTAIRIGVQPSNPPITRVVVDLKHPQHYSLLPGAGKVILRLGPTERSSTTSAAERSAQRMQPGDAPRQNDKVGLTPNTHQRPALPILAALKEAGPASAADVSNAAPQSATPAAERVKTNSQDTPDDSSSFKADAGDPVETTHPPGIGGKQTGTVQKTLAGESDGQPADPPAAGVSAAKSSPSAPAALPPPSGLSLLPSAAGEPLPVDAPRNPASASAEQSAPGSSAPTTGSVSNKAAEAGPGDQQVEQLSLGGSDSEPGSRAMAAVLPTTSMVTPPPDIPKANQTKPQLNPGEYVIGEQDQLAITVWKEKELSGIVAVRPDGKITLPLLNEIQAVGLTPAQLQDLLTEKYKPFLNVPQVTVAVRQINSRNVYLIGQVGREGMFPINSSTTVLQLIAEAGGLKDFAKRKGIYILRKEQGKQARLRFNYDEVIRGKNSQQNIILQPGDTVVVP